MRPRVCLAAVLIAALCAAFAPCQGLLYRERWGYLHLEQRRHEVQQELRGRDAATRANVAQLLLTPDEGVPFRPVAHALAHLRGVAADDAYVLRTTVCAFLLPEVVDPVGDNEVCRRANLSIHLPYTLPLPEGLGFVVEVADAAGDVVFRKEHEGELLLADLRMAQVTVEIPCQELADGSYRVRLLTLVAGRPPAKTDPIVSWPMHVRRGYQAHAVAAMQRAQQWTDKQTPLFAALLTGLSAQVARAFTGEPFDGGSRALAELDRLTQAQGNLERGEPLLAGMTGDVALALPAAAGGGQGLGCVLRLPAQPQFGAGKDLAARPLLVIAAGAPAYDCRARRPDSPATRLPVWTSLELPADLAPAWNVAFLESPGAGRNYVEELGASIEALQALWGNAGQPVVLVCEREAAAIVGIQFARLQPLLAGLVLVGGGAMPATTVDALGATRVRHVCLRGTAAGESQRRTVEYAAHKTEQGHAVDCTWLLDEELPWAPALPHLTAPLRQFLQQVAPR